MHLMFYLLHHGWRVGRLLKKFFGGAYGIDHLNWLTWLLLSLGIPAKTLKKYFPDGVDPFFPPDFIPGMTPSETNPEPTLPPFFDPFYEPDSRPGLPF